jgi:arylsulfatase
MGRGVVTEQPNVVFILADQHRWDFMGGESNGVTLTPNLDRLAVAGTRFRAAYCTAPLCCPSRAAIASGRYGMNTGCFTNLHQLPPHTPTFVQQFRHAGYRTCAVGKTHMEIHAYDSDLCSDRHRALMDSLGWDEICETSGDDMFRTGIRCAYSDFLRAHGRLDDALAFYDHWGYFMDPTQRGDPGFRSHTWTLPEMFHGTAFIGEQALTWLRERDRERPFFLQVGFAAPHSPVAPVAGYLDPYRDTEETEPWDDPSPPAWLPAGRTGYRAMISQVDAYVGAIRDCLAEQGVLDDTIVVYTADHGEMAGDHGRFGKTTFYEGSVRVPMLFAGPGIGAGQESAALVEVLDAGKTLNELCGVAHHALDQGRSLAPILTGERTQHRETVYAEMGCDRMLRDGRHKLAWGEPSFDARKLGRLHLDKPVNIPPSPPALYDLVADPHELQNLAGLPEHRAALQAMQERLLTRLNENTQTRPNLSRGEYRPLRAPHDHPGDA